MRACALVIAVVVACVPPPQTSNMRDVVVPTTFEGGAAGESVAAIDWRAYFADADLNALIGEAIEASPDLQIALRRIDIAGARIRAQSGAALPQLSAFADAGLARWGRFTPDGAGNATTDITPGRPTPNPLGELAIGVRASWELDLWGRIRSLRGAARMQYLATIEGVNLVVTSLVGDVAVGYFELLALDRVRTVVQQTIARQTQALEMIRAQKEAGRTNELAVQQFEAQLAGTRALDAVTLQRARELENQLNVLVGRMPQPIRRNPQLLEREVAPTLATGVPADLLRNRPDIREAELQIRAARFDVAAARTAFYPTASITADAGYRAFSPRFLLSTPGSIVSSIVGGLTAPLINRRGLEAELAAADATQIQALYHYRKTILTGFGEVATLLSALDQSARVLEQRKQKKAAVAGTVEAADALFRAGKATYLEVLLAQQNTLEADLELIEAARDRHVASVRLYRALGGGWRGVLGVRPSPGGR
jgi:NodT family efflux transporter outer membrane factor (OMF) lipoprotein